MDETKRLYSVLEMRLKESPYLAGDKYTIADIASYSWIRNVPVSLEIDLSPWPALKKWVDEIGKREAVQKGADVPKSTATPEEKAERYRNSRARIDAMTSGDKH